MGSICSTSTPFSQADEEDEESIDQGGNDFFKGPTRDVKAIPIMNENDKISYSKKISLNDFTLVKILGKGSFGKVVLVEKKDSGNFYAMKILNKAYVAKQQQKLYTKSERQMLENFNSPFIVQLRYAFQTQDKLYLVLDFMNGGELFFHLRRERKFNEARAKFYAAEILLALEYIHSKGVIYRDLKPENLLIDAEGHIRLTDFGLSKQAQPEDKKAYTFCGTLEYVAPEIIQSLGHDKTVDYWSLGVLLYEMLAGTTPFYSKNPDQVCKNILKKSVDMKSYFSPEACSLLSSLLVVQPKKRLSNPLLIKKHDFFKGINWDQLALREATPPFQPDVSGPKDLKYFDKRFTEEKLNETPVSSYLTNRVGNTYQGFTYQGDTYTAKPRTVEEIEENGSSGDLEVKIKEE